MKKLLKLFLTACILIGFIMSMGGCSYLLYKDSQKEVAYHRAVIAKNEPAIKAMELGNGGAGIGIDITALDALKEHPYLQLLAAVVDAGLIYGGYKGVEKISGKGSSSPDINYYIDGDNNDIIINTSDGKPSSGKTKPKQ